MASKSKKVLLYLDNSNIFYGLQLFSGSRKGFKPGISDANCRMRLEALIAIVLDGREPDVKKAYGKMTYEVSEILKKTGFEVAQSGSSGFNAREKEADTMLTADAVEDLINKRPGDSKPHEPHGGTIILMSGDLDMIPLIKKARKYGWNVEVWAYADTLSTAIKTETERKVDGTTVVIKSSVMENSFEKYTHSVRFELKEDFPLKEDRTLVVIFRSGRDWIPDLSEESRKELENIVVGEGHRLFHLPVATKFLALRNTDRDRSMLLAVTVMLSPGPKYDFENEVWQMRAEFVQSVRNSVKSRYGGRSANLEVKKYKDKSQEPYNFRNGRVFTEAGSSVNRRTPKAGSAFLGQVPKSPYSNGNGNTCKGEFCPFGLICKNYPSACPYAHERAELKCARCSREGCHTTEKCRTDFHYQPK